MLVFNIKKAGLSERWGIDEPAFRKTVTMLEAWLYVEFEHPGVVFEMEFNTILESLLNLNEASPELKAYMMDKANEIYEATLEYDRDAVNLPFDYKVVW